MPKFNCKKLFMRKKLTPKELRLKYGALTKSNDSNYELIKGAEKQWRRYVNKENNI